nr:putative transposase En/Spm [Ipomoea batatas]
MSDREEPSIVLISTLKVINMPTYGVGVVQEGGDDLLHNPLVLTKVEVNPIGSTQGLDDHYEIEDESEESEQDDEVVYEDSENDDKENVDEFNRDSPSIAQVHHVVLRDHQEVVVKMSQRKRNRGKGKTVTGSHSQADISQPPSLHALIDDPEEGSTPVMEDTDSERTPSSSRPIEHTTEGPSEHTSYAASESIDEATLGGGGEGAKLLSNHLQEAREGFAKNRAKPDWISDDVMAGLVRICRSDEFKKLFEKNKRNKNSDYDGLGASLHNCGSIPMTEHPRRLDVANDLRQSQADASNAQLWSEAIGGVKRGGYVYVFGSDTQHYFPEASRGSNSKSAESSSNAALLTEIQQMREENKMFREEVGKMGAILTQLSPNTST